MSSDNSGIYSITCVPSGRRYIGQSVNIPRRWRNHKSQLRAGKASNLILQRAWDKYGEESFKFKVVEKTSIDNLDERELYWMHELNTLVTDGGFNICDSVDGTNRTVPVDKAARARAADSCSHRFTAFGKTQTLKEWSKETGVSVAALRKRLTKLGYSPEVAFSRPAGFGRVIKVMGREGTLKSLAEELGFNRSTVKNRINTLGWCPTKAFLMPVNQ